MNTLILEFHTFDWIKSCEGINTYAIFTSIIQKQNRDCKLNNDKPGHLKLYNIYVSNIRFDC